MSAHPSSPPHAAADAAVAASSATPAIAVAAQSQTHGAGDSLPSDLLAHLDAAFASSPSSSLDSILLRALDAHLVSPCVARLHAHVLPSVSAFEWGRRRDLPPSLVKAITRPSPPVFLLQAHVAGLMRDAFRGAEGPLRRAIALHLCAHALMHAAVGAKEVYLSLGVSRFHSRQLFVDLASTLLVMRSFTQTMRTCQKEAVDISLGGGGPDGSGSLARLLSSTSTAVDSALRQVDLALLELSYAMVVTHPTLMSLDDIARVLQGWEQHWTSAAPLPLPSALDKPAGHARVHRSGSVGASAAPLDTTVLAQQLGVLWLCEPFALESHGSGPFSSSGTSASAPSFLDSFFSLPQSHLPDAPSAALSGYAHWVGQELQLASCSSLTLLLDETLGLRHLPPARLLRLLSLRHHLRVDDYPELSAEEETQAAAIRTTMQRLQDAFGQ